MHVSELMMGACASSASHPPSLRAIALLPCSGPALWWMRPAHCQSHHPVFPRTLQVLPLGPGATVAAETEEQVELAPFAAGARPAKLPMGGCLLLGLSYVCVEWFQLCWSAS